MCRDEGASLATPVAKLNGKLSRPFQCLKRLCNGRPMVEPDDIVGAPKPQQRFHLLGGGSCLCSLTHR
jgi:hypothetical protein